MTEPKGLSCWHDHQPSHPGDQPAAPPAHIAASGGRLVRRAAIVLGIEGTVFHSLPAGVRPHRLYWTRVPVRLLRDGTAAPGVAPAGYRTVGAFGLVHHLRR